MQNDNQPDSNTPTDNNSVAPPPTTTGGQRLIQPSPELVQELQAQQQQPQPVQPTVISSEPTQPSQPAPQQSAYTQPNAPANGQMQVGMSASQMGWSQSSNKGSFSVKKLIIKGVTGLVVVGVIFAVLVYTNIIALSQFKTVNYTNSSGTHYSLTFYSKHTSKTLKSGNAQLVSKVSEGDKYPITLSISSGPISNLDKNGIKTCSGSLPKVFDVQNNSLNQQISVCSFPATSGNPVGVYVMGFASNNQAHIVTIGQYLSGVDLSSQSGAQQSLPKFGLDAYQDDIKTIVSSIKVE